MTTPFARAVRRMRRLVDDDALIAARLLADWRSVAAVPREDNKRRGAPQARPGTDERRGAPQARPGTDEDNQPRRSARNLAGDGGQPEHTKRSCRGWAEAGGDSAPVHDGPKDREPSTSIRRIGPARAAAPPPSAKPAWLGPRVAAEPPGGDDRQAAIEAYIAEHGVTRCPGPGEGALPHWDDRPLDERRQRTLANAVRAAHLRRRAQTT